MTDRDIVIQAINRVDTRKIAQTIIELDEIRQVMLPYTDAIKAMLGTVVADLRPEGVKAGKSGFMIGWGVIQLWTKWRIAEGDERFDWQSLLNTLEYCSTPEE